MGSQSQQTYYWAGALSWSAAVQAYVQMQPAEAAGMWPLVRLDSSHIPEWLFSQVVLLAGFHMMYLLATGRGRKRSLFYRVLGMLCLAIHGSVSGEVNIADASAAVLKGSVLPACTWLLGTFVQWFLYAYLYSAVAKIRIRNVASATALAEKQAASHREHLVLGNGFCPDSLQSVAS